MKRLTCLLLVGVCSLFLQSAVSGAEPETKGNIPYHATGKARVYFYCTAHLATGVPAVVRLDGVNVGDAGSNCCFYVDTTPEEHAVETAKGDKGTVKFKLENGGTAYVKLNVANGEVTPEVVDNAVGAKESAACKAEMTK
jgi:hypothetical protein